MFSSIGSSVFSIRLFSSILPKQDGNATKVQGVTGREIQLENYIEDKNNVCVYKLL